jgi:sugar/nucleoside kinase (ribokinase family)
MRHGIIAGGNLICDNVKIVDYYPSKCMMARIVQEPIKCVGGGPHNVLVTLSKLQVDLPLSVLGVVGTDENAEIILKEFIDHGIDTSLVSKTSNKCTSFTEVISELSTGDRTFLQYAGANAELSFDHFQRAKYVNAKIFYLGKLLILPKLQEDDFEYGLVVARILDYLYKIDFKTSIDMVSITNPTICEKIFKYALKHLDYLIINEIETQNLTGLTIRHSDNSLDKNNLLKSCELIIKQGLREVVVVHYPEGGFAMDKDFNTYSADCFKVDQSLIKSSLGCGDAFNAGVLYGLHEDMKIEDCIRLGNAMARFCLFDTTSTGGAQGFKTIQDFLNENKN